MDLQKSVCVFGRHSFCFVGKQGFGLRRSDGRHCAFFLIPLFLPSFRAGGGDLGLFVKWKL